jgi:hypothetical protein
MALSNFPQGFTNGVTIRGIPITQVHPGKVFYVNNSTVLAENGVAGSDGNPGTLQRPFSTIDYAIGRCTAGRGDIIFVMPGHAETVIAATTIALDVAGIAILGLGTGTSRPTLTFTTANTATLQVNAANISIKNILFVGNFLSIASAITVATATASPSFTCEQCEFQDTDATHGFLSSITTTVSVNADNLAAVNNVVLSVATTNAAAAFVVLGTMKGLTLIGNRVTNTIDRANTSVFLSHAALVMTDALIKDNTVYSANSTNTSVGMFISTSATTGTGMVINNTIRGLDIAAAIIVTAAAVQYGMFNNLYIGDGTMNSGFVLPAIGSDA